MAFLSLQPFFIILIAPFMGKFWQWLSKKNIFSNAILKVGLGLCLAAISFFIFAWAASCDKASALRLIGVVAGNLVLGIGELCTLPILLSAISNFAPMQWRSTMMGILFLSLAFSGYLAGIIARISSSSNLSVSGNIANVDYTKVFTEIGITAFLISVGIFCCAPALNRFFQFNTVPSQDN
jgi:POT family proton-dependent oligopeptide transporter